MIKKLIKIISIIFLLVICLIVYLSFVGIKTEKFNEIIVNKILEINKNIELELKDVKFLLDPYNFKVKIVTVNPAIILNSNKIFIKRIKTNISLRALIFDEFSIDDVEISSKPIMLKDIILLARSFNDSVKLFLLDRTVKEGFLSANIKLKFDENGKIKDDYQIKGFIKKIKFDLLNKFNVNNLNFEFDIKKNKYSFTEIKTDVNDIKIASPIIEINQKKDLFFVKGKILTAEKEFNVEQLSIFFDSLLKKINLEKIKFSSVSDFSFNINKNLTYSDLDIKSKINLDQLILKNDFINLKPYLPNSNEILNFVNQKIAINYNKNNLEIKGNGDFSIKNKFDSISYQIIKDNDKFIFETKTNLKNNKLLINFLNYEKKENLPATILIKGSIKKNNKTRFDLISLVEKENKIIFKNLNLNKDFKITSIDSFNFNYMNSNNIKNELFMKKDNLSYTIKGETFDATKLINKIMDSKDDNSIIFDNFNPKINLKINKTYIDQVYFVNNLLGTLSFKNNKIVDLNLRSIFSNNKTITLTIKTNDKQEKITKLYTDYPKPLVKRYKFIKGFEKGYLDYYSVKKNGISNSLLIIDNFKVKEVPIFAKLLSLASLQGIADLLTGDGIRFTDFEMKFINNKKLMIIEEMYAIGPAVSIMMDGHIQSNKLVRLKGTLVPATTINRAIASIPVLGSILVGKKTGEGVFGVSFKIKGAPKDLKTSVNPVKTLTPRFITRTLEKIKKN
tara:strand:+ start:995 stop:3193 length:2199 start_codon:yes stop_codon:yes gene_type:complete